MEETVTQAEYHERQSRIIRGVGDLLQHTVGKNVKVRWKSEEDGQLIAAFLFPSETDVHEAKIISTAQTMDDIIAGLAFTKKMLKGK